MRRRDIERLLRSDPRTPFAVKGSDPRTPFAVKGTGHIYRAYLAIEDDRLIVAGLLSRRHPVDARAVVATWPAGARDAEVDYWRTRSEALSARLEAVAPDSLGSWDSGPEAPDTGHTEVSVLPTRRSIEEIEQELDLRELEAERRVRAPGGSND